MNKSVYSTAKKILLLLLLLIVLFLTWLIPVWAKLDEVYNDYWRRHIAENATPSSDILIIEIDDKSLTDLEQEIGRWPWPRSIHASVVEKLQSANVKAIVFDIIFAERDIYRPEDDTYFNESIQGSDNVFYAASLLSENAPVESIPLDLLPDGFFVKKAVKNNESSPGSDTAKFALPWVIEDPLQWNIGLINYLADWDGVARRYPAITEVKGWQVYSLPARVAQSVANIEPTSLGKTFQLKYVSNSSIPHQSVSYSDVWTMLRDESKQSVFSDKIVIIGATATGLHDLRESPIATIYPATSVLATAMDNLINNQSLTLIKRHFALILAAILFSIVFILNIRIKGYRLSLFVALAIMAFSTFSLLVLSYKLSSKDTIFPTVSALAPFIFVSTLLLFYSGLREFLNKRHALKTFSRFMDPQVVKTLVADENWEVTFDHKSTQVSVLFSDIRGFTSLSEKRTASEIMTILNNYFDSQVESIFEFQGTLDKFIGDCIMAFWGAPIEDSKHAEKAILAALQMVDNLIEFRESLPEELRGFDVGIGIHSGEAVVGMLGSAKRFDYTAIGDTVNLASRIEGKTKGIARVLVSESTKALCEDKFNFEFKGQFAVKGREEEVKLYEPSRRDSNEN